MGNISSWEIISQSRFGTSLIPKAQCQVWSLKKLSRINYANCLSKTVLKIIFQSQSPTKIISSSQGTIIIIFISSIVKVYSTINTSWIMGRKPNVKRWYLVKWEKTKESTLNLKLWRTIGTRNIIYWLLLLRTHSLLI